MNEITYISEDAALRQKIVKEATSWIGTPYQHQASNKNIGADCLGLIRGIWRDIYGDEPAKCPPYTPNWAEHLKEETLLNAAKRFFIQRKGLDFDKKGYVQSLLPGDLIIFRWQHNVPAKHCGIVINENEFIHSMEQKGVIRAYLVPSFRRRIAGVFKFPMPTTG